MKLRNIAIVTLILLILCIPVSFASDNADTDDLTNHYASIYDSDYSISSPNQDYDLDDGLDENNNHESYMSVLNDFSNGDNSLNDGLGDSSVSSNQLNSSFVSNSIALSADGVRLADLNSSFSHFNLTLSDSNTVYVNSSYGGAVELGTKLNPYKTLSSGINAVNSSLSNVYIANGIYGIEETLRIGQGMTLIGESLGVVLDGLNKNTILSVNGQSTELAIFNVTFRNAYSDNGSAIYNDRAVINIVGSVFSNNSAYVSDGTGYGGAIYNDAGFLRIYNSSFISNRLIAGSNDVSEAFAGAIYNELGELTILNSRFANNSIDLRNISRSTYAAGGAIFNHAGFMTIFNSSLSSNSIYANYSLGGAVSIWSSRNVYIINSTLNDNIISGNYGFASAVSNKGTLLHIENSTISNNRINASSISDSTVYNMAGNYDLINSRLQNNTVKTILNNQLLCLEDQIIISDVFTDDDYSSVLGELNLSDLPSRYDMRDEGLVTSVKNQGASGACWTFAFLAAMESYLLKFENASYDFSENNMKNLMGDGGENSTEWDDGGNYVVALAYLLRWSGPVNESDDPFSPRSMDSPYNLTPEKYLTDVAYIPLRLGYLDNDQIKLAVLKYGALFVPVSATMFHRSANVYSNIQEVANHAVAIVGWDDDFQASKFSNSPPGNGAFIVKNSWGNGGDNGYYYVSYYDASFAASIETCSAVAIVNIANTTEYRSNYQYDVFGNTFESVGYSSNIIYFANQFVSQSNNPLSAFGFYTYGSSQYVVNITVNGRTEYVSSGNISNAGYHTIKLSRYIGLRKGDIFRVTVKLTTPSSLFPLAIETNYSKYTPRATSSLNQSFISPDGKNWYDLANVSTARALKFYEDMYAYAIRNASVCLKAYTAFADELELIISSNSSVYYVGDSIKLNVTLSNVGDYATDIYVPISLDEDIGIISYDVFINSKNSSDYPHYTTSEFNSSSGLWHIDNLNNGESLSLIIIAKLPTERNLIINASAGSSTYSVNDSVASGLSLKYRIPSRFNGISPVNATARSYDVLNFTLKDINGNALANKTVYIELVSSDNAYVMSKRLLKTDSNGIAKFTLNLTLGNYRFKICFDEDNVYQSADMNFTVNVSKRKASQIIFKDMTTYSVIESIDGRIGEYFNVTLKDCDGYVLSNKPIQIGFNGKAYNKTTDSNGVARLQINLKLPNTYTFAVCFLSDDDYYASFVVSKITVIKKKMTLAVPNLSYKAAAKTKTLTATLKDNNNKLTAGKTLIFVVNGKSYTAKTNSKGIASVKVSLSTKKTYSFTVKFAGDDYYGAVTKTGKVTIK